MERGREGEREGVGERGVEGEGEGGREREVERERECVMRLTLMSVFVMAPDREESRVPRH